MNIKRPFYKKNSVLLLFHKMGLGHKVASVNFILPPLIFYFGGKMCSFRPNGPGFKSALLFYLLMSQNIAERSCVAWEGLELLLNHPRVRIPTLFE